MPTQPLFQPSARSWFATRFLAYLTIAVGSAVAFFAWAAVYTYVWPGAPPASVSSPREIQKPAPRTQQVPFSPSSRN